MILIEVFLVFFIIVEVTSQSDVLQTGDDELTNDNDIAINPPDFNFLDYEEIAPPVDNFIGGTSNDNRDRQNVVGTLRAAHADPTLHKWKHKLPLFHSHSHIHSIVHGRPHSIETIAPVYPVNHQFSHETQSISHKTQASSTKGQGVEGPVIVYPVNHQFSQQSQSGHMLNDQFSNHHYHGIESNSPSSRPNSNQENKEFQQTQHSTFNQNSNHFINNLNVHQSHQNGLLEHIDSSGRIIYPSDTLNPGIVNINGHSNTVIQSGTSKNFVSSHNGQVFFHENSGSPSSHRDHLIGISMPIEEEIHWQNKPQGPDSSMNSRETAVAYDREMNNILDILDERSYQMTRPDIQPNESPSKQKHADDAMNWYGIRHPEAHMGENSNANYNTYEGWQQQQNDYDPENGGIRDYNLESPSLIQIPHNDYFHSYDYRRNSRHRRNPKDIKVLSDNSMFFNISSWRLKEMNSKLNDTLLGYRNVVDDYRKKITDKRESIFVDLLDSIIGQFQRKDYENSNEIRKIEKRSATITKLLNNPDARLDVPKTLENIGTITRNAFEDKRSPMYHVRQFIGSTKNAVLSAMKIPPQNLVIPSNYEIKNINPEEISDVEDNMVSGINPKILSRSGFGNTESMENYEEPYTNDPYGIVETFARVGGAIRDSVRSGQNTLNHISDIAHNARKIYQTTKNSVPRVLLPYAKAPVLKSRFKGSQPAPLKKAIVISPKVLAVKDPVLGSSKLEQDFVSMGNILDAIGLTKPDKDQIDLEKIVLKMPGNQGETRGIYIPPIGEVKSINGRMLPNAREANENIKEKNKAQIGRIQEKVSSTNKVIKDSINKMKNDISRTLDGTKNKINENNSDILQMEERNDIDKESNAFPQTEILNNTSKDIGRRNEIKHFTKAEENEIIDKFLENIFKTDPNLKGDTKLVNIRNKMVEKTKNSYRKTVNPNKTEKGNTEPMSSSENNVLTSDILPNITEALLQETLKNITLDLLRDEKKNTIPKMTKKDIDKLHKDNVRRKKKFDKIKKPKIVLESRFGDYEDADSATPSPNNSSVLQNKSLDKNDEEAMRKVDEYVMNDVAAPMLSTSPKNENDKNSFKLGNILEVIEEPSSEVSINDSGSEEEKQPVFSSRNLLWIPNAEENEENSMVNASENNEKPPISKNTAKDIVGLNLPHELMTPFMSRASKADVNEVFGKEEVQETSKHANSMRYYLPSEIMVGSSKPEVKEAEKILESPESFDKQLISSAVDGRERVGLNLPPELMSPFMSRASNTDIGEVFAKEVKNDQASDRFNLPTEVMVGSAKSNKISSPNDERQDSGGKLRLGLNQPRELMNPIISRASTTDSDKSFKSDENEDYNSAVNDNNEMQSYLPILMMPLRTTKSVKKTLDEFLKKENETRQQILNAEENRLKHSSPMELPHSTEDVLQHFKEKGYPPAKMIFLNKNGCKGSGCHGLVLDQTVQNSRYDEGNEGENVMICGYISHDSNDNYNQLHENHRNSEGEEIASAESREGGPQARTSMAVSDTLKKPFMGLGNEDTIKKFYEEYNGKKDEDGYLFDSEGEHMLFSDD